MTQEGGRGRSAAARCAVALCFLALPSVWGCASGQVDLVQPPVTLPVERPTLAPAYRASGHSAAGDVFVHLFEWKWTDIASECTAVLGPAGYKGVQVSPPQEHLLQNGSPWWQRYQPASYSIAKSRSGTRAEFVAMVASCKNAGVDVYVDAVINHMSGVGGTGSNGSAFTKYAYPGLYTNADFHTPCAVSDYQSAANVQDCELVGLSDLKTGDASVQQKIADYLIDLARIGVAGFRIDAAKHMQPVELNAIVARVNSAMIAEGKSAPWFFGEVIDYGGEAVKTTDYFGLGFASGGTSDITEFKYRGISDKFLRTGTQKLADLSAFSAGAWGLMPADKAVVFVENHDTQRDNGVGYRDGDVYRLANVWMLAQPYGYPSVMSSYAFDRSSQVGRDAGPPGVGGVTASVVCAARLETAQIGDWVCEHRDAVIRAMVAFRRFIAAADVNHNWDNGANAVAFSRGDRGFVVINRESGVLTANVPTGLPAGTYCDVLTGGRNGAACTGARVVIEAGGVATVTVASNAAVVLTSGTRLPN